MRVAVTEQTCEIYATLPDGQEYLIYTIRETGGVLSLIKIGLGKTGKQIHSLPLYNSIALRRFIKENV